MTAALVALGSNLPPRRATLQAALADLDALPATIRLATSRFRETAPVDAPPGSGPFLNGACLLATELTARELLAALQRIEQRHGRLRGARNAPRTLDLDLVLFGEQLLESDELVLPHPRAHERLFVLEPAAEIAPRMRHPRLGLTLAELLATRFPGAADRLAADEA